MTFLEYQNESQRTCPSLGHFSIWQRIVNFFRPSTKVEPLDACHMVLGINSEINEMEDALQIRDTVNLGEEIADAHWYISNLCRMRGYDYADIASNFNEPSRIGYNSDTLILRLYREVSLLQDVVKKEVAYGKSIEKEEAHLRKICWNLQLLADRKNISIPDALRNNIAKLRKRFPKKFTKHNALNRNLVVERKELEK